MLDSIRKYRSRGNGFEIDPLIGALILAEPFFWDEKDWIPIPKTWSKNIVQGKTYDTSTYEGMSLYKAVSEKLKDQFEVHENEERFGKPQLIRPRLGQGGFRILVTEAYHRKCAITGEKTLPVLDASHIKPYGQDGPHRTSNGLLLRQDLHTLFDRGYLTIDEKYRIEVSRRIKEDYGNGKEYYAYHGSCLANLPDDETQKPSKEFLLWHNENVYCG